MDLNILDASIKRGFDFLQQNQLPSGEFKLYGSSDMAIETERILDSSPFATQLVAYSLSFSEAPQAQEMIAGALRSLKADMELPGMWRHWTKNDLYGRYLPPDADDTVCAAYLLRRYNVFDCDNRNILLANRSKDGLFYTWFVPRFMPTLDLAYWKVIWPEVFHPRGIANLWKTTPAVSRDIDGVVNANVLLYLGADEETQPVINYLIDVVKRGEEDTCDKWYNRYMFYYSFSRNYHVGVKQLEVVREESIQKILAEVKDDGSIGDNHSETAISLCSLFNWNEFPVQTERAIEYLLSKQRETGDWQGYLTYFGAPKRHFGWGSEEITTALCLEAIMRYRSHISSNKT